MPTSKLVSFSSAIALVFLASAAAAQEPVNPGAPTPDDVTPSQPQSTEPARGPRAVMAWQLRGLAPQTQLRLDNTLATYTNAKTGAGYYESVNLFSGSYQIAKHFALQGRFGAVHSDPVSVGKAASGITNATVGFAYGTNLSTSWRLATSASVGIPIGSGSGNKPDADIAAAQKAAAPSRAYMDNTMFGVNDVGVPVGADLGYVKGRFTAQVETNIITSFRVQGEKKNLDANKVNFTSGIAAGYFIVPDRLSFGAELHNQRYLTTPAAVAKDATLRNNLSAAAGVRFYVPTGRSMTIRPGISYGRGLAGSIADNKYQMVQLDLPVTF